MMKLLATTYRTLSGIKEVISLPKKKNTQWVIYQNNQPAYFVDFYDLEKESNVIMNSLVLCSKRSMSEVLDIINEKNNINLSIAKVSRLNIKLKTEVKHVELQSLPKKWLNYSL